MKPCNILDIYFSNKNKATTYVFRSPIFLCDTSADLHGLRGDCNILWSRGRLVFTKWNGHEPGLVPLLILIHIILYKFNIKHLMLNSELVINSICLKFGDYQLLMLIICLNNYFSRGFLTYVPIFLHYYFLQISFLVSCLNYVFLRPGGR